MGTVITEWAPPQLLSEIAGLAAGRQHRLPAAQTGGHPLSLASALAIRKYLQGRPAVSSQDGTGAPGPASQRPVPRPGRRPGRRVEGPGIFYYEDHVYKVLRSAYSGHLRAKKLVPPGPGDGSAVFREAPGMLGILREEDRMTPAQSRAYEALYGYAACSDCGLPLENDLSRQRRKGPVCYSKNGPGE